MDRQWRCLKDIRLDTLSETDPFLVAFDCFSVFVETKGILIVFSYDEVITIKMSVTNDASEPLKCDDLARIKGPDGLSVVRDNLNSFLLTRDKRIFLFKSFKKLFELAGYENIKVFKYFKKCYILVEQIGINLKIKLMSSFNDDCVRCSCEFDLSFPTDPVSINGNREENICVEMIEGPLSETSETFFNEFLACNLRNESICDILLTSIDNKLIWVKYKNSFNDGASEGYTIESITTASGAILGVTFCGNCLLMLDSNSTLTAFYLCPMTRIIKKKEIQLNGKVKCFRFYKNLFIYSNMKKVFFINFSRPHEPSTQSVDLKGIVCFTVVSELKIIIAICHNCMFYHLRIPCNEQEVKNNLDFQEFTDSDVEAIPSVTRCFEVEEQKLTKIAEAIKEARNLKLFLQHVNENKEFSAGSAIITFSHDFPKCTGQTILCSVNDQRLGSGFIEIKLNLSKLLLKMRLSITLSRFAASGVIDRIVKIDDAREEIQVVLPAEVSDDVSNEMTLDLNFSYKVNGEEKLIRFPINITQVIPFDGPRIKLKSSLDDCLLTISRMKM